jgi:hypothetical protein
MVFAKRSAKISPFTLYFLVKNAILSASPSYANPYKASSFKSSFKSFRFFSSLGSG